MTDKYFFSTNNLLEITATIKRSKYSSLSKESKAQSDDAKKKKKKKIKKIKSTQHQNYSFFSFYPYHNYKNFNCLFLTSKYPALFLFYTGLDNLNSPNPQRGGILSVYDSA